MLTAGELHQRDMINETSASYIDYTLVPLIEFIDNFQIAHFEESFNQIEVKI